MIRNFKKWNPVIGPKQCVVSVDSYSRAVQILTIKYTTPLPPPKKYKFIVFYNQRHEFSIYYVNEKLSHFLFLMVILWENDLFFGTVRVFTKLHLLALYTVVRNAIKVSGHILCQYVPWSFLIMRVKIVRIGSTEKRDIAKIKMA